MVSIDSEMKISEKYPSIRIGKVLINTFCIQEDAHITNPAFADGIGLFAVFDGHGGLECAKFCEKFFEPKLRE